MRWIGAGLALLLSACGGSTEPVLLAGSAAGVFSIEGAPTGGAAVELHGITLEYDEWYQRYDVNDHVLASAQTASDGSYEVQSTTIPSEICDVPGSVVLRWGATIVKEELPSPCDTHTGVDFPLTIDTVAGHVYRYDQPVAGAAVVLRACEPNTCQTPALDSVTTGSDGSFELQLLGCQEWVFLYEVWAGSAQGYGSGVFRGCPGRREVEVLLP